MVAGTPVASTDVGDSADLVGDPSRVVPPCDPGALAEVLAKIINMDTHDREAMGARDRQHVLDNFSIGRMAEGYAKVYRHVLQRAHE